MRELDLTDNDETKIPDVKYIFQKYFSSLKILDLSGNSIKHIEGKELIKACPKLERFAIVNNLIASWEEFLPLGRLENLKELDFRGNPIEDKNKRQQLL